jgi:hypothetical protein
MRSKKITIGILAVCLIVVLAVGSIFLFRGHSEKPKSVVGLCKAYSSGTFDPASPDSVRKFAQDSQVVAVADVLNPEVYTNPQESNHANPPRVRITKILKGDKAVSVHDTLKLCPGVMSKDFTEQNTTVLLFLAGTDDGYWVPNFGLLGVIPQNADGSYEPSGIESKSVTIGEIQELIK